MDRSVGTLTGSDEIRAHFGPGVKNNFTCLAFAILL